ncbi:MULTISPECIES: TetR/AcrR family transcriptional regulator [Gordonia]|jgi:AcrR family transcriptional regulator|uniref:TetR family transcriptional regulator n=2 Tax=Gordonia alkanivorans TaxID=84096 RepID=W9DCA5_9ACTN|nr:MULTISPECIES: TetR/AcrR family transcriptional regulator [Gordonia]ETA06014.1 TetR family transcriptional regulator [Gordonia alkanivorans CGMCC 6845]MDH3009223.1 helix-turn-helix domain containing protein [Gordonia alkanivorans]MDH3012520.1 helix-turn-helix domain containing protein [Gordonia alkanivorans]MDH3018118.1 helix-turn-helix domain containing protein [Gordonia alkanivorans]MDH3019359.1 helix-turn-helix domain containing protein [Gordonia alkanivorans]
MATGTRTATTSGSPGRPRLVPSRRRGETARDEILDAAAELFTRHGYTGTSTRMIAEAVGIRQASMYHHFSTKDDILAHLLETTVVGSVEQARTLLDADGPALERLLTLARYDVEQLARARWNLGALYLLPEVGEPRFVEFRSARQELAAAYAALTSAVLGDPADKRCLLPFRLVESVIMMRADEQRGELGGHTAEGLVDTIVGAVRMLIEHRP